MKELVGMNESLKSLVVLSMAIFYIVMLTVRLSPLWRRSLRRMAMFCRRSVAELLVVAVFVVGVVHRGATKGTNGNDRVASQTTSNTQVEETGLPLRDGEGESSQPEGISFTYFAADTNAVHFAVSLPPDIYLPEGKLDLFATHDVDTNVWELVGNYDILPATVNLTDTVPLSVFQFPSMDRLFLALGTRADLDCDGLIDSRERFMYGTSPCLADTDGDGLLDGDELAQVPLIDPLNPDSDGDGYFDGEEAMAGTNPHSQNVGAANSIRYFYDDDDRLISANAGSGGASSGTILSPSGNGVRLTALGSDP